MRRCRALLSFLLTVALVLGLAPRVGFADGPAQSGPQRSTTGDRQLTQEDLADVQRLSAKVEPVTDPKRGADRVIDGMTYRDIFRLNTQDESSEKEMSQLPSNQLFHKVLTAKLPPDTTWSRTCGCLPPRPP